MSGFSIEVDDRQVKAALHNLRLDLADMRPAMAGIGQVLVTETDLAFRGQKDPWGQAWARLSEVTLKRRRQGNGKGSNKILRDTGRLANSINHHSDKTSVTVGTNVVYAAMHQFGGTKAQWPHLWGNIPARPFLPIRNGRVDLPPDTLEDILDVVRHHLSAAKK
jgi:phage virion morphogenesis protein